MTGVEAHKCSIQVRFSSSPSSMITVTSGHTDGCIPWPSIPFLDHVCCVCVVLGLSPGPLHAKWVFHCRALPRTLCLGHRVLQCSSGSSRPHPEFGIVRLHTILDMFFCCPN